MKIISKNINKLASLYSYRRLFAFLQDAAGPPVCRDVHFEVTSLCNLKCIMCPVPIPHKMLRKQRVLSYELFQETINSCKTLLSVGLNNWGEPLLHDKIIDMIAFCNQRRLHTIFATNATLLSKELSKEIMSAGLTNIECSIDGLDDTYKKIRNSAIDAVLQNINEFIVINKQHGNTVHTCIVCTVGEQNSSELRELAAFWEKRVDAFRFQPMLTFQKTRRTRPCPELSRSHLVV